MLSLLCEMHALDTETRQGVRGRMKKGIIDYYDEVEAEAAAFSDAGAAPVGSQFAGPCRKR